MPKFNKGPAAGHGREPQTTNALNDSVGYSVASGKPVALCTLPELVAAVVEALRGPTGATWIGQAESAGGRGRHCSEVRRRVAGGLPGARIIGRRHELSPEAYSEFLGRISTKSLPKKVEPESSAVVDELRAELRLVGGGR